MLDTISKYGKDKKVTETSQNGYTKGKSCLTNLTLLLDKKTGSMAEGRAEDVGHLDFMSKATLSLPQHPANQSADVWSG